MIGWTWGQMEAGSRSSGSRPEQGPDGSCEVWSDRNSSQMGVVVGPRGSKAKWGTRGWD